MVENTNQSRETIYLSPEDFAAFIEMCEAPPEYNQRLREAIAKSKQYVNKYEHTKLNKEQ